MSENKIQNDSNKRNYLRNIKSSYFLIMIFNFIKKKKILDLIRYNKTWQNELHININDYYKEYSKIEIELFPYENIYGKFINIPKKSEAFFHKYFNGNENKEIKKNKINKNDKATKINIILDNEIKSLGYLFNECRCIRKINFKKFNNKDIISMNNMFYGCSSIEEINVSNINTNNVKNMSYMFHGCSSLKELNLSNFNTNNVTNMKYMFSGCSSLIELNLSNFNTNKVTDMSFMFYECLSLNKIILTNFDTKNVIDMSNMFMQCSCLKELDLSSFHTDNLTDMNDIINIFLGCSSLDKIICSNQIIKNQFKK